MALTLPTPGGTRAKASVEHVAFPWLVGYYWVMQYALPSGGSVERGGLLYLLYVLPAAGFVVLVASLSPFKIRFEGPSAWIGAFLAAVVVVSLARGDLRSIFSVGLFSGMVLIVLLYRMDLSTAALNRFFLASMLAGALAFAAGHSVYAIVPGFSADPDMPWRVSLFPFVAPSAFFALLVTLTNLARRRDAGRWPMVVLGAYFVVFSGIRSAWLALAFAVVYLLLVRAGRLRSTGARLGFLGASAAVCVALLLAEQLAVLLSAVGGGFVNAVVFRAADGLQSPEQAAQAIYRGFIWTEHLRLALSSPIIGIGTFDFASLATFNPLFADRSSGSEAFLTGLLARVGLVTLLLLVGLGIAIAREVRAERHLALAAGIILVVAMLAYGSFLNAYDFVFLCLLSVLVAPGAATDASVTTQLTPARRDRS